MLGIGLKGVLEMVLFARKEYDICFGLTFIMIQWCYGKTPSLNYRISGPSLQHTPSSGHINTPTPRQSMPIKLYPSCITRP